MKLSDCDYYYVVKIKWMKCGIGLVKRDYEGVSVIPGCDFEVWLKKSRGKLNWEGIYMEM
jgi:hypothetical protein